MRRASIVLLSFLVVILSLSAWGQVTSLTPIPPPPPALKLSALLAKNLANYDPRAASTSERRERAYEKLMEAQRYIWRASPSRGQGSQASNVRLARSALQAALELDPGIAEGYTALAELSLSAPPSDIDEGMALAKMAIKVDPNNFGGHRILARLYTYKSNLNNGNVDQAFAANAKSEWQEVTRLDPRNAEAWAFLSEYYELAGKPAEQIDALKKWMASASPLETQFYRRVMGGRADLSPESASLKLAPALIKAGRNGEAIEVLSLVVADEPDNSEAIDLLKEALQSADARSAAIAVEALQQAVYANQGNTALILLLAEVQAKAGRLENAAKLLRESSDKLRPTDAPSAANLQVSLGDLFLAVDRFPDAVKAYEKALSIRGLDATRPIADDERDFAIRVFEKLINTYKRANRPADAKAVIERARRLLGKNDLFSDRQSILLFRETGNKAAAIAGARNLRLKFPGDYSLMRVEASLLAENGRVDEAVQLVKKFSSARSSSRPTLAKNDENAMITVAPVVFDDFSKYLLISQLFNDAHRGKEAVTAARSAYSIADSSEKKQIAKLSIASAQQESGDFAGAETTLRELLKQNPGNPIALNNLGYFLTERGERLDEALTIIQQAVRVDPTNPSYLDSLGWVFYKLGRLEDAESYLRQAIRFDSASATSHEHLGDVYFKQGKADLAKTAWEKALQLGSIEADVTRLKGKLVAVVSR